MTFMHSSVHHVCIELIVVLILPGTKTVSCFEP